ncbi:MULTISPECIES: precorrin-8X methylmutase [unclassified Pseudodesulfovibrio]|uniref:precorrin-8X methylmutase n=1 Tax=unclassified Pseudodesulfovibrio TaxID=2661612 RepID=UPI000FEB5F37|nr:MULTISPECIES: precorrin-8X methylmutase [unclassified Pseudodesulfovibrio]MCJ2163248.1 precorrin-8X methylmutase [Pseudodesulfovibrio sp. S3-i]RWU07230.1 precorrin-8X methylmutase [Pseudodesulfovibrio sp. S3]
MKPEDIETESFRIIDSEVPEPRKFTGAAWTIVRRMIHTTADFELLDLVRIHEKAVDSGIKALQSGAVIVSDTEMAKRGMPVRRLDPLGCVVHCLMNDERVAARAAAEGVTRAKAAVDVAVARLNPDIWVVGNAPTALIRLVEHLDMGAKKPALIIGMPVGFVNAAESKALLMSRDVPYISIEGRKGGSALAASVVNALAVLAV